VREQHLTWWTLIFVGRTLAGYTPDQALLQARDALATEKFTRGKGAEERKGVEVAPTEYTRAGATINRYPGHLEATCSRWPSRNGALVPTNPVRDITKRKEAPRAGCGFLSGHGARPPSSPACAKL